MHVFFHFTCALFNNPLRLFAKGQSMYSTHHKITRTTQTRCLQRCECVYDTSVFAVKLQAPLPIIRTVQSRVHSPFKRCRHSNVPNRDIIHDPRERARCTTRTTNNVRTCYSDRVRVCLSGWQHLNSNARVLDTYTSNLPSAKSIHVRLVKCVCLCVMQAQLSS